LYRAHGCIIPEQDLLGKDNIPAGNMLPEVAYVKLAWALGQTEDLGKVKDLMLTPIAGEIIKREPYNGYLKFQGGIPEVEEFIRKFYK
jgi:glutamyl-tRNA(Gln) amidotransferase subunit D